RRRQPPGRRHQDDRLSRSGKANSRKCSLPGPFLSEPPCCLQDRFPTYPADSTHCGWNLPASAFPNQGAIPTALRTSSASALLKPKLVRKRRTSSLLPVNTLSWWRAKKGTVAPPTSPRSGRKVWVTSPREVNV